MLPIRKRERDRERKEKKPTCHDSAVQS